MNTALLKSFMSSFRPEDILSCLEDSAFDEMLEINIAEDFVQVLYHINDKYYLPFTEGVYSYFFAHVMERIVHPDDQELFRSCLSPEQLSRALSRSPVPGILDLRFRIRAMDREWRWIEQIVISGISRRIPDGMIYCYIYDIQNQKDREAGVTRIKNDSGEASDSLTTLVPKNLFFKKAQALIDSGAGESWLMINIDLEKFKLFNDWYGRTAGDQVLSRIGAELRMNARRVGGFAGYLDNDDFCLVAPDLSLDIKALYNKLQSILLEYGTSAGFLPSFGVSKSQEGVTVLDLFDRAALACDYAKKDFKNRIRYYSPFMREETEHEFTLLTAFQEALSGHEITFFLQPQCHVSTGAVIGAEALARWQKKDGTYYSPAYFIPVLEKYGFITDLDKYIWEAVASWIHDWLSQGSSLIPISVNVSQIDIFTINVPEYFKKLVEKYALPWNAIKIEITESACADDSNKVSEAIEELRELGFLVLMDDFGSGYSSLNMLHEMEVDAIKMDARFLHLERQNEEKGIHILESVVNMAKTMGLPVIMEGVENAQQKDFLMHLGCRYIQGYYFYRPMTIQDFETLIRETRNVDLRGIRFKANEEFHVREFLDETVYSDSMLNTILGPVAIYSWQEKAQRTDIIRFNEQFYEAVHVTGFHGRLSNIERFMTEHDQELMQEAFKKAVEDHLNGSSSLLSFFRPEGGTSRFLIHFYYLGEEGKTRRFYGSARDVTQITQLQQNIRIFTKYFPECVVFLMKDYDKYYFHVAAQGLKEEIGLDAQELEDELNQARFYERVVPEHRDMLRQRFSDIPLGIDFSCYFSIINTEGRRVTLFIKTEYIEDESSDILCILIISHRNEEL